VATFIEKALARLALAFCYEAKSGIYTSLKRFIQGVS